MNKKAVKAIKKVEELTKGITPTDPKLTTILEKKKREKRINEEIIISIISITWITNESTD